jgi:Macrocin-O-methyltransferase (TylF)
METSEEFFVSHPHVVPALLYLDFDIYEPTKKALEIFYPRMPKGSIIVFDELNDTAWPGETLAMYEVLDIKRSRLEKITFDSKISYLVVE